MTQMVSLVFLTPDTGLTKSLNARSRMFSRRRISPKDDNFKIFHYLFDHIYFMIFVIILHKTTLNMHAIYFRGLDVTCNSHIYFPSGNLDLGLTRPSN